MSAEWLVVVILGIAAVPCAFFVGLHVASAWHVRQDRRLRSQFEQENADISRPVASAWAPLIGIAPMVQVVSVTDDRRVQHADTRSHGLAGTGTPR